MAGYSGDAGDALAAPLYPNYVANGRNFSSPGSDNDDWPTSSCTGHYGGWWYGQCGTSALTRNADAVWTTGSSVTDVQASRMLVQLN